THAPARGATKIYGRIYGDYWRFNPRSRAGSDSASLSPLRDFQMFQPTLPRGERPAMTASWIVSSSAFQPTLPRGERPGMVLSGALLGDVSTHAPARGATE